MSGWQLGLALFGCWLGGVVCCGAAIYFYARHVLASKVAALAGLLTGAAVVGRAANSAVNTAAGRPSNLPPPGPPE